MKQLLSFILFFSAFLGLSAQSPTDGLMMPKGSLCNLVSYSQSSWDNYWEGETKRTNANLGTFKSQNVMLMGALGLTDKLNVMAAYLMFGLPQVPVIWMDNTVYKTFPLG